MLLFAAATPTAQNTTDRLKHIPAEFWWKMAIGVAVVIAAIFVLRKIAKVNKLILTIIVLLAGSIIGFNWIYERNEPAWATPAVQWLSGFFPSKGKH